MIQAAKATAHVFLLAAVCLPAFANIPRTPLVAEKPHLGVADFALTLHRAESAANALNAPGLPGCLYDSGTRPCCSGKERDSETGLDYFLARYYSSAQGRFTSPDEWAGGIVDPFTGGQVGKPGPLPYADVTDPQTVNKYAYVRNNPIRYTDPDGHVIDTIADIAFIGYDIYDIAKNGATVTSVLALGADVVGAVVPFATGLGTAVRAGHAIEAGVHVAEAGVHGAEGARHAIDEGTVGELRAAGKQDAHHIIQDAAVKNVPGYNTNHAPGIQLPGPSTRPGAPHQAATAVQRQAGGGTYAAERRIGSKGLRKAGLTPEQARRQIKRADEYFEGLGVTGDTVTRVPGNR